MMASIDTNLEGYYATSKVLSHMSGISREDHERMIEFEQRLAKEGADNVPAKEIEQMRKFIANVLERVQLV